MEATDRSVFPFPFPPNDDRLRGNRCSRISHCASLWSRRRKHRNVRPWRRARREPATIPAGHEQGLIGFAGVPLMWEQPPLPHVASTGHWATDTLANSMSGRTARNRKHRKVLPVSCFQALARFPRKSPNSGENGDPCVSLDVFWHDRQGSEEAICGTHSPGMMYARCRLHVM